MDSRDGAPSGPRTDGSGVDDCTDVWYRFVTPALAAGEPGKEILYPIATVIVGGLLTSTLAEFFVRPALFWTIGQGAGKQIVRDHLEGLESTESSGTVHTPAEPVVAI